MAGHRVEARRAGHWKERPKWPQDDSSLTFAFGTDMLPAFSFNGKLGG